MRRALLAFALVVMAMAAAGCSKTASSAVSVAGDTRVDLVSVAAPKLTTPTVDISVGIGSGAPAKHASGGGSAQRGPSPAGRLAVVTVRAGQVVRKGQVVARFDDTLLRLGLQLAQAARRRSGALPGVLSSQASTLRDQRATVRSTGRSQLLTGQQKIDAARAKLKAGIAAVVKAKAALPALEAQLAGLKAQLAALVAKPVKTPTDLATIAALKALIAQLAPVVGKAEGAVAGLPNMRAGLKQLDKAQAQLDAGRATLNAGLAKMTDAIDQLSDASSVAKVAEGIQSSAVLLARAALAQATLTAPCDGVVVSAMHAGEVAMVGAPVVTIRPAGPTLVDTYLEADQLARIRLGAPADVTLDSVPGPLRGVVKEIDARDQFPPSSYPTQIVHLSRVVRVTVSVPDTLPLGVPADVVIRPSS